MPGVILIIIALIVGAMFGVFTRIPNQAIAVGEIVSIEQKKSIDSNGTMYTAYVEYYVDGIPYTVKIKYMDSTFRTGQKMRIAYNKMVPEQAIVRPNAIIYMTMAGFIIAGIVICYISLLK